MLTLGSANLEIRNISDEAAPFVTLLSDNEALPKPLRARRTFLARSLPIPEGFDTYVVLQRDTEVVAALPGHVRALVLPDAYDYLADGDILRVAPRRKAIRALYRRNSPHNFLLMTERCNNYCLMCSQPPKQIDDSWIVDEILQTLPLIDRATPELGFTGGEPTLLGDDFIRILQACKSWLPDTSIHILSNGRRFADFAFSEKYAAIDHPDMMVGIPLYSDISHLHDYVVQADGAFDETIRGILNLKRLRQKVEIRVVIHKQTYERLPQLAEFIARNLLFVDQVVLMGLEMTGFTKANLEDLWIDPYDYRDELRDAVQHLVAHRMNVSIYNHQLCLLYPELWPYARKSISDWKNEYMPECEGCAKRNDCGGFFSSAKLRYSAHIRPFSLHALENRPA
jgi:His-Xaa-Ser system radical SAM maturase HxsC